jgi:hypothetical protein
MSYMPTLIFQLVCFAYSAGLGFSLGIVYDLSRMLFFILTGNDKKHQVLRDIIYLLFCLLADFIFVLVMSDGQFLLYIFIGQFIGLAVYFYSVSPCIFPAVRAAIIHLRGHVAAVYGKILSIKTALYKKTSKKMCRIRKICKKHLHIRHNIVYNFLRRTIFDGLILRNRGDEDGKREKE